MIGGSHENMSIIAEKLKKLGLFSMYGYLEKDPEENLPKLLDWLDTYITDDVLKPQREIFRKIIEDEDNNWYRLIVSLWSDIDDDVRKTLFENIIINANALASHTVERNRKKYKCNIPWVISIELDQNQGSAALDFDRWDDVIEQAKSLGTFIFIFHGGEPLNAEEEIIALCNKHSECEFMIYTDGKKLDEKFVQNMLRVRNLIVGLQIEGRKLSKAAERAAKLLHSYKLPYIGMCFYDKDNQDEFNEEAFFDELIEQGFKMILFLSSLKEEDDRLYDMIQKLRETKPIMSIDFCKDRELTGGCVAGGRYYCNINVEGGVEPCFFVRQSDSNVLEKSLVEAYQAPLFMSCYNEHFRCPAVE